MKILLVDDDDLNVEILKEILNDNGFGTLVASDGIEAIEKILDNPDIRIVLLDRMMPRMDGMEFIKVFGNHPHADNVAIIFQTAANQPKDVMEGISTGAFYYLTKPFEKDVLISVIQAAIDELKKRGVPFPEQAA